MNVNLVILRLDYEVTPGKRQEHSGPTVISYSQDKLPEGRQTPHCKVHANDRIPASDLNLRLWHKNVYQLER